MNDKIVGFDCRISLRHLDYTAREAQQSDLKTMYRKVHEFLQQDIGGYTSRKKATTMLMRIWYLVKEEYKDLQKEAFALLSQASEEERPVIHWGMTMLAYTFFTDLAAELGHFFTLQTEVAPELIGRKMKRLYGDKRRVEVATTAVLLSMKSWGILAREKNGKYTMKGKTAVNNKDLRLWLAQVIIRVSKFQALPIEMITSAAFVFPFKFELNINEMENRGFSINRQGIDMVMVGLF